MIPDQEEVFRSLFGAYLLAWLDRGGMGFFNLSFEGFWRSFFAAALVAPGYVILVADKLAERAEVPGLGWIVLVHVVAYAVSWATFPLAAIALTRVLDLSHRYVALVVAVNWAAVIQVVVFVGALALQLVLSALLAGIIVTAVTIAILVYHWFVIRTALDTTGGIAVAVLMVDLVLNAFVNMVADGML